MGQYLSDFLNREHTETLQHLVQDLWPIDPIIQGLELRKIRY